LACRCCSLTPFAAVFYPVSVLPGYLQPVALARRRRMCSKVWAALVDGSVAWATWRRLAC
jgi:ABC-2 type transport system permease protein